MDKIRAAADASDWTRALSLAGKASPAAASYVAQRRWREEAAGWTADSVRSTLDLVTDTDWVVQAVLAKQLDRPDAFIAALDHVANRDTLGVDDELLRDVGTLRERVETYIALFGQAQATSAPVEEADAWGLDDEAAEAPTPSTPSIPLPDFLALSWLELAQLLASESALDQLRTLFDRHGAAFPPADRLAALDCVPLHTPPESYVPLVPPGSYDWLVGRVERVDAETGMLDIALSAVEHGAGAGVPGLETLAEDLSLLCTLVYDARAGGSWDLARWRAAVDTPAELVRAYLGRSTAQTIVEDVRSLVMPFLYVLEARAERAGQADPTLPTRLLYAHLLERAPLDQFVAVVEASKPNLPLARRLIRDNADLARIALARLYAERSTESDVLASLSSVFECMPAFDGVVASTGPISPLASLLPAGAIDSAPSAAALYAALRSVGPADLSLALDTLDVHLEAAETLKRWSVPASLAWFLRSCDDAAAQRLRATRLARRATMGLDDFESDDEWEALMEDMVRLSQPSLAGVRGAFGLLERGEVLRLFFGGLLSSGKFALARSLFSPSTGARPLDTAEEQALVIAASREFFENAETGNYHAGEMKLAYDCLSAAPPSAEIRRERDFIEATSRLTSYRLTSTAQPGQPLGPLEIRSTADKLALIHTLLAAPNSPYGQPDTVLELLHKLDGRAGDKLRDVRALAMVVEASCRADEPLRASEVIDRIVQTVEAMRKTAGRSAEAAKDADAAADVAWRACRTVGSHPSVSSPERRMALLGRALLLCPEDQIMAILPIWRSAERALPHLALGDDPYAWTKPPTSDATQSASALDAALSIGRAASVATSSYFRAPSPLPPVVGAPTSPPMAQALSSLVAGSRDDAHVAREAAARAAAAARAKISGGFTRGVGWLIGTEGDD